MHGHSPGSALLLNAEVDSMGGVVDGVGVDSKTSPRRAAIEKAQAELRLEYDVREERRRELEFLEKGGNPLDFKLGSATSISVQSTSLTDQHADQYVISEAKGSFALTASPHGDSVDSSGRPGVTAGREPNIADNLQLFDGENDTHDGEKKSVQPTRRGKIASSEQSSQQDGSHNAKESEDSAIFRLGMKNQAYARRNRSRSSRDASSTDLRPSGHGNGSSVFPSRHVTKDAKGLLRDARMDKDRTVSSICNSKTTSPNGNAISKILASENQMDMELDAAQTHDTMTDLSQVRVSEDVADTAKMEQTTAKMEQTTAKMEQTLNSQASLVREGEGKVSAGTGCVSKDKTESFSNVGQLNGFKTTNRDSSALENEGKNKRTHNFDTVAADIGKKGFDSESCFTQIQHSLDDNVDGNLPAVPRKINGSPNGCSKEQVPAVEETSFAKDSDQVKENEAKALEADAVVDDAKPTNSDIHIKAQDEVCHGMADLQNELKSTTNDEAMEATVHIASKLDGNLSNSVSDNSNPKVMDLCSQVGLPGSSDAEPSEQTVPSKDSAVASELQNRPENDLKLVDGMHEDAILAEAQIIEARLKRVGELSFCNAPSGKRRKSHWDFVLEEMAWLANDFMQERLWKTTAAAQMSHWVASSGRLKFDEANLCRKQKKVARIFAKAIFQFWHSAEMLFKHNGPSAGLEEATLFSRQKVAVGEALKDKREEPLKLLGMVENMEKNSGQNFRLPIQRYAVRFLKYNNSLDCPVQAEAPTTPERITDTGILELTWDDRFSEESLFYAVPPGAMSNYRKSVESFWAKYEKIGSVANQEEFEASLHDSVAEYGARDNVFEENDGETGVYYLHGPFEGSKSSKLAQRKRKYLQKSHSARAFEAGADISYGHCSESKMGNQLTLSSVKRPSSSMNVVSIPTKRVRTAARQRVVSPFSAGVMGGAQMPNKTDASSGDTSSFQDEQSSLHGGSELKKSLEVESTGDFVKQTPVDNTEASGKPKKKKPKNLGYRGPINSTDSLGFVISGKGSTFEQRWQLDSTVQHEQKDLSKKRLESQQFDSNGNACLYGPNVAKKPKILKQLPNGSPESITPGIGSMPSPVASQMSNMPNKLIKMITNRDRGRKPKALKIPAGQSGSGSPWSLFEDQALVVLVHDMGPNWELISDAINSTLQFKCIFRKPKECKERHHYLMDRNAGDGADSAEDSGSSQPYPSTLPGIPKGSARQLLQRLQGPAEEDTLKSHFEKIILIGRQLHSRKSQNDNQELKQISPVHNSHMMALNQVCPNNLNGSPLTPLDLCNVNTSSTDIHSLGYQASHTSGLAVPSHQNPVPPLPTSAVNSMLQGSSSMVLGNSLPSPSTPLNAPSRDMHRYSVQRPPSLPIDEQRMQQYNQMLSGRNIQQPGMPVSGALPGRNDRGVHMLPGGNGIGMMGGMSRGMGIPRPGFQGIASPAMLNMVSSGGIPNPVNIHTGVVSGQGNSMLRPRDTLQMMRPGQNTEDQRQLMIPELQMQVTQGNGQGVTPFNGLSAGFSSQTVPPVQSYPVQHQQPHQMSQQPHMLGNPHHSHLQGAANANSHTQAYAIRLAKERQHQMQQQRMLQQQQQQQQQQFTASSTSMTHAQGPSQHSIPPIQNNSPIQQQVPAQPSSLPSQNPLTPSSSPMNTIPPNQQKQQHGPQGLSRNLQPGGAIPNQMLKQQRQRQQHLQQPQRPHPPQRQQPQQQAKVMKGLGRGNMMIHQSLPVDATLANNNALPPAPANQVAEKGEQQVMHHLMQGQGLFSGPGSVSVQPGKPLVAQMSSPGQPQPQQQKMFSRPQPSPKQLQQISSHLENSNQGQGQVPSNHTMLSASQPPLPPSSLAMGSQQPPQLQRQTSQSQQSVQRMLHQNRQASSDVSMQSSGDQAPANNTQPANGPFQMVSNVTLPHGTESTSVVPVAASSAPAPSSQWKPEPMYDSSTTTPSPHLANLGNSPQPSSVGTESMPSSSQGLSQRQFPGSSLPVHGHHVSGQWQQSQPQQHHPPQQQHRQAGQGGMYARPSTSGPG